MFHFVSVYSKLKKILCLKETAMGIEINAQTTESEYIDAVQG